MKMCGRVNANPSLAQNENFRLLVMKCRGITPTRDTTRPEDDKSHWDNLKDDFKKENPDVAIIHGWYPKSMKQLINYCYQNKIKNIFFTSYF